jgi:hypothetical protein
METLAMALVEINWNPRDRQLRQFGLITLVALPLVSWALNHFAAPAEMSGAGAAIIACLVIAGVALGLAGLIAPRALRPSFVGLQLLAWPIGLVMSELLMLVVYFGLFAPTALWFRLIGRDVLQRRVDHSAPSYWSARPAVTDVQRYFRQA